jgi:hypothetical protein
MIEDPTTLAKHAAGPLGAISAMLVMNDTWPRRIAMFVPSVALSYYGGDWIAEQVGLPASLAGFLVGLLGMAFIAKILDTWDALDLGSLIKRWITKLLGLPPEEK